MVRERRLVGCDSGCVVRKKVEFERGKVEFVVKRGWQ
jgi:hypothetical protein